MEFEGLKIRNVPGYAKDCSHIVYRSCEGQNWFYGAYDSPERAYSAAHQVRGHVAVNTAKNIQKYY